MTPAEAAAVRALAPAAPLKLGERLLSRGLVAPDAVSAALENQRRWGCRFGEALIAQGSLTSHLLVETLAEGIGLPSVDLIAEPPDETLCEFSDRELYLAKLFLPWRRIGSTLVIACADPSSEIRGFISERYGPSVRFAVTGKFDVLWTVQSMFRASLGRDAILSLDERNPEVSARRVLTSRQLLMGLSLGAGIVAGFAAAPDLAAALVLLAMSLMYGANIVLRLVLFAAGALGKLARVEPCDLAGLDDAELPVYSILVPLYHEAHMVGAVADAICALDYPAAKLDIKLVLEEDDAETIAAAKARRLDSRFEIICVPNATLRTKPRACNYGLNFVRGAYTVIYDAEDRPEPDQLKKAVAAFSTAPRDVVCFQARLNVYNVGDNWLTRMFALEYAAWFDFLLPGLARLGIPIPLGGTSNHFRTEILRQVCAWDAFNVTEDADLGLRLARLGYRVLPIDSTTFEEAVPTLGGWIRQRSRWLKGYMQTALVHGRAPLKFVRATGLGAFAGVSVFVGGAVLTALVAPPFWVLSLVLAVEGSESVLGPYGEAVMQASFVSLLGGTILLTAIAMLAPLKRRWFRLAPYGATVFLYWLLISAAAYKAVWQLFRYTFYWEKTEHGVGGRPEEARTTCA